MGKTPEKSDCGNRNEIIEIIIFIHCRGLWIKENIVGGFHLMLE